MSHEIETMAYVGAVPWHGLGTQLPAAPSVEEMLEAAGLDWTVSKRPLFTWRSRGEALDVKGHKALVRDTDHRVLSVVTDRYVPVQNRQALELFRRFCDAGHLELETAGALKGGAFIWALARIGRGEDDGRTGVVLGATHAAEGDRRRPDASRRPRDGHRSTLPRLGESTTPPGPTCSIALAQSIPPRSGVRWALPPRTPARSPHPCACGHERRYCRAEGWRRTALSPTRSGPEGSSRNELGAGSVRRNGLGVAIDAAPRMAVGDRVRAPQASPWPCRPCRRAGPRAEAASGTGNTARAPSRPGNRASSESAPPGSATGTSTSRGGASSRFTGRSRSTGIRRSACSSTKPRGSSRRS
jgi:hypothetical protein